MGEADAVRLISVCYREGDHQYEPNREREFGYDLTYDVIVTSHIDPVPRTVHNQNIW
jgi:hypothetical protein